MYLTRSVVELFTQTVSLMWKEPLLLTLICGSGGDDTYFDPSASPRVSRVYVFTLSLYVNVTSHNSEIRG